MLVLHDEAPLLASDGSSDLCVGTVELVEHHTRGRADRCVHKPSTAQVSEIGAGVFPWHGRRVVTEPMTPLIFFSVFDPIRWTV